jgi:hypothetical protein
VSGQSKRTATIHTASQRARAPFRLDGRHAQEASQLVS